jgi:hypothetical protein
MNVVAPRLPASDAAEAPVIVAGAPRTGVRLLAAILDAQPTLASGPDLTCLVTIVRQWHEIDATLGGNHARHHGLDREATAAAFRATVCRIVAPRLALAGKCRFVLQSFAAVVCLDRFAELFPAARVVVTVRDPLDALDSMLDCDWHEPGGGRRLPCTTEPALAAAAVAEATCAALRSARPLLESGRAMLLRYEDLCRDPRGSARALGRFLGERIATPRVEADSAVSVTLSTDYRHPPLRVGPVHAQCIGRGRRWRERADLAATLGPLRRGLGYA